MRRIKRCVTGKKDDFEERHESDNVEFTADDGRHRDPWCGRDRHVDRFLFGET